MAPSNEVSVLVVDLADDDEVLVLLADGDMVPADVDESTAAEGPRTRVVNRCSRLEQESVNICVTLIVEEREYRFLRAAADDDELELVVAAVLLLLLPPVIDLPEADAMSLSCDNS